MANRVALQQTLEFVKDHQGEWDQTRWSRCFAGMSLRALKGAVVQRNPLCCDVCEVVILDGDEINAYELPDMAQEALDLTEEEAKRLFHGAITVDGLAALVEEFTEEATAA